MKISYAVLLFVFLAACAPKREATKPTDPNVQGDNNKPEPVEVQSQSECDFKIVTVKKSAGKPVETYEYIQNSKMNNSSLKLSSDESINPKVTKYKIKRIGDVTVIRTSQIGEEPKTQTYELKYSAVTNEAREEQQVEPNTDKRTSTINYVHTAKEGFFFDKDQKKTKREGSHSYESVDYDDGHTYRPISSKTDGKEDVIAEGTEYALEVVKEADGTVKTTYTLKKPVKSPDEEDSEIVEDTQVCKTKKVN